jgi:hypothetical protein
VKDPKVQETADLRTAAITKIVAVAKLTPEEQAALFPVT